MFPSANWRKDLYPMSFLIHMVPNMGMGTQEWIYEDFPGGPMFKTLASNARGTDSWSGNEDPMCRIVQQKKKKKNLQMNKRKCYTNHCLPQLFYR